jgi:4-hydroxy-3-polyprenylbenzoate decarboxylase
MKTLANVASGNAGDLVTRIADVTLKERRPLVVMPREKPLSRIHLENMLAVTDAGGIIMPPLPSFYQRPDSLDAAVTQTMRRALSYLDIDVAPDEWEGL